ncbi:hypothetical protein ABT150_23520 [Streptomyces mirabilis]|uniref:hypothetical protein n=1 Tax=Streptomyces mirabilis TaxID=68239 RepID=UPI003321A62C
MASTNASRKPRTTVARPAARPAEPDEDFDEADISEAEAQEAEAVNKYVTARLTGVDDTEEDLRIIPPGAWRQSWQRLLNSGQVDAFAKIVLHSEDYEVYLDLDPTNEQFGDMVSEAAERAGESLGKSSGPAPSSRRTRRR